MQSLRVTRILLDSYIPSSRIPAVLPGVVSTMCHVALGRKVAKGWQNGDIVQEALDVLATVVIKSIGDVVCIESGIIKTLFTLPALILSRTGDAKLERSANQITALCQLARHVHLKPISSRIAKLLGPNGGIEKWGTSLLGVLELTVPAIIPIGPSPVGLIMSALEAPAVGHPFPRMGFRYMSATSTVVSLERMFQSLGRVGAVEALFAVEWLVDVAIRGEKSARAAALWCAVRVLEGIGGTVLAQHAEFGVESRDAEGDRQPEWMSSVRRRMEKATRMIVKNVCGMWEPGAEDDDQDVSAQPTASTDPLGDSMLPTEYVKGFAPLTTLIAGTRGSSEEGRPSKTHQDQRVIQYALALQMLSICASILGSLFPPLLLHSLYPILRSIVSSHAILSETAMAALYHVTNAAAYASPGNLLLANFDYALDSTSRRLLRRQLDVKATKVLVLLVRLVGKDVVKRAGDVVEECFDRLDEYHGYGIVVEGLVEVLQEVVKAVELDEDVSHEDDVDPTPLLDKGAGRFTKFVEWYQGRNRSDESSKEEYGPAPREAWGKTKSVDPVAPQSTQEADTTKKPTPTQELISKIIKRCLAFLTHPSALIRTRILSVLRSSVTVLPAEEIQPSIHKAWPFVLNRLKDGEVYVVAEAAGLIETLAAHAGVFMSARVCDDVWPTYRKMLDGLEAGDRSNALAAARGGGPRTVYSASHRLHRAILSTMRSVFRGVHGGGWIKDDVVWQVAVRCRGFLDVSVNEELQAVARGLFMEIAKHNDDLVWMVLSCTMADDVEGRKRDEEKSERQRQVGVDGSCVSFLKEPKWDIMNSASLVL
ncbi:hypothetical protein FRB99_005186 [Tulasnella sp. 403]|nr:hypothetical protein FRB99_005186 [Tulasnella sp. 403]